MRLKLTLKRAGGPEADIVVTTDAAATVGDIAATIGRLDPFRLGSNNDPVEGASLRVLDSAGNPQQLIEPQVSIGDAPLANGSTIAIAASRTPQAAASGAVAVLRVIAGPDKGKEFPLQVGSRYLGRDAAQSDITLRDDLVSKRHARIDISPTSVRIVDLNSANGLEVDGGLVTRLDLEAGTTVRVGDSLLQAEIIAEAPAGPVASGPIGHNRSPRVETRYPGTEYIAPKVPGERDVQPFPILALIAPLILGGAFILMGRGIESLIFVAASPILMLGTFLTTRGVRKRKEKADIARFDERAKHLEAQLEAEVPRERAVRLQESPSTYEVYEAAMSLGPLLWTRRPEHWQFLSLNLGVGTMPSRNSVKLTNEEDGLPVYLDRVTATRDRYLTITGVPVTENLYFSGALGIAGPRSTAADVARGIIVQATALHSPSELVVAAIAGSSWTPDFEWLKWLPHTGSAQSPLEVTHLANSQATGDGLVSALEALILSRKSSTDNIRGAVMEEKSALVAGASAGEGADVATPPPAATPAILLLITDDAPVDRGRLVQLAEKAADAGIYPIWIANEVANLPAVTRTFVETTAIANSGRVGLVRLGSAIMDVTMEPISRDQALRFARRLAPVFDMGAVVGDASDIPRTVSMLSLLGPDITTASVAVERWKQNDSIHDRSGAVPQRRRAGRLRALVGSSGVDAMHLDLRTQGPHALVGGTTGSGKSEFLQAWVLGMAAEYSPDRVTFLFVDYKGGSAFADCVELPHCVGLVTDLSPHLVRRALTSLRAELHHREHLFNRKKAKDLLELEKSGDPESPPALVLVIDEFAALAGEVPEFVDGVVDIAQRGRSLGIHLIMATQRPAGVIKDNLRANTNLRVALRMADESDSMDVVGDKIAGTFDPSIPGRGIAKTGPGRLVQFQSAYAGGWTSDTPPAPSVDVAEFKFGTEQAWEAPGGAAEAKPEGDQGPNDQKRLVASLVAASKLASLPAPRRPWLDELASAFDLAKLRQRTDTEILLGVRDIPQAQRQEEVYFKPDSDGSIAIFGAGGTGKTTTLRTIAASAGITPRGGPVDVYGIDFGTGGLRMLEALPHVGSIVSGDDPERVVRLLRMLRTILDDRAVRYSDVNAGTIVDYRRIANAPQEKRIILLVDNFPAFRAEFDSTSARAPWWSAFNQILSDGRALGMHVAFTADRPGSVPNSVSANVQRRVVHRLTDDSQYVMLDEPNDVLSATSPAGRALMDGLETQIAIIGGKTSTAEQSKALVALGDAIAATGREKAVGVGVLATEYPASQLPDSVNGLAALGISDDTLEPVGFEPIGTFLIAGPPASGRTNALRALLSAVQRSTPKAKYYYLGNARSTIGMGKMWEASAQSMEDVVDLAKELSAAVAEKAPKQKIVVVIEQIADFLSSSADGPLVELIKAVKRSDHFLIADSESSTWNSSWPLLGEVKSARTGFLIQPDGIEGETILKTAIPRVSRAEFPPGRGFFIARGKATRVQLPLADEAK